MMMTNTPFKQSRLVADAPPRPDLQTTDDTRCVFDHWVFMLGRHPSRCKLGPTRRAAINAALLTYDADHLMQAIEGMAADPLAHCDSDRMRDAMREVEWLLKGEARIERWADAGLALRERSLSELDDAVRRAMAPPSTSAGQPVDAQAAADEAARHAAARQRLRDMAARARAA